MAPGPIDIHPALGAGSPGSMHRNNSGGPVTSNLTSALRAAGEMGQQNGFASNQPSINMGHNNTTDRSTPTQGIAIGGITSAANHGSGKMLRRESMAASEGMRSLMNGGMSWGGVSVGSWIRDDIIMTGTSPFTYQSPSFHSSSYLPKLEANFFRDFACCGQTLPSLHDLLQHYEEVHAQQLQNGNMQLPQGITQDRNGSLSATNGGAGIARQQQQQNQQRMGALSSQIQNASRGDRMGSIGHAAGSGVDVAESMEMDDDEGDMTPPSSSAMPVLPGLGQQHQLPQTQVQSALRMAPQMPHQNPHLNNPTVSSVNTPNMPNPTTPIGNPYSNENSVPGTPRGMDGNADFDINFQNMNIGNPSYLPIDGDMELGLCIDDPGKALFNHLGSGAPRAGGYPQNMTLAQLRAARDQAELQRLLGQDGMMQSAMGAGVNIPGGPMQGDWANGEDKPFKCPVIGCEKAYKNQNGLKYHKNHGHINQTLHLNPDGSYSIVNPETSIPYPGTLGMEKEKPYKCEFCGKRYKNLNGLKYHRGHSTHGGLHPMPGGIAISDNIGDIGEE